MQTARVADIDKPRSTCDNMNPLIQLRFGENRSTTIWEITFDNVGGECNAEAAELSQPLVVSADKSKVGGASFAGALIHGTQPGGLILLGDALWHRSQIFRVDPSIAVVLGQQDTVLPIILNGGGMDRLCGIDVGANDRWRLEEATFGIYPINPRQQHKTRRYFHLAGIKAK